ncbi:hypothetical protein AJ79_02076 [Helicocarpus griseus UAMH5409]|uniref:Uncharacterized protein n=1 Tax=Helicocarpus griseus UAMH5409 TaxID=1447875 RepID=A0A2B7Y435_9EURO|nr:hypothetical protein AJ79_02076 [Helicocarpus griseus UAMH5409]
MSTSSTTLMTFLVRTPPNARTVKLLGSWDNFSKAYPMERDSRIGRGHWKGCHTFTNIICDGETNSPPPGRDGGLRMGGTYWYYYQLDNEVDFFNEAEPVTTSCPFLPGQPLNVLNVPINLPSSDHHRSRDASPAPQRSSHETMNPEDKYMNPRAPPRPVLPRLTTSPAMLMPNDHALTSPISSSSSLSPINGRSVSHPRALAARRKFHVGSKLSIDIKSAINPSPMAHSLRSAIMHFASPRFNGNGENRGRVHNKGGKGLTLKVPGSGSKSSGSSSSSSPKWDHADHPDKPLPQCETLPVANGYRSNEYSSRHRSGESPNLSPLKATWTADDPLAHRLDSGETVRPYYIQLNAYQDSVSQQNTPKVIPPQGPSDVSTAQGLSTQVDLHRKRLPTLPNSPSSVLEAEMCALDEAHSIPTEEEYLQSHFSDFTAESPADSYSRDSFLHPGGSHFSECSTDTEDMSPSSMTSSSTFNNDSTLSVASNEDSEQGFELMLEDPTAPNASLFDAIPTTSSQSNIYIHDDNPQPPNTSNYCPENLEISTLCISKTPSQEDTHWRPTTQKGIYSSQKSNDKYSKTPSWTNLILKHNNYAPNSSPFMIDDNSDLPTPRAKPGNYQDQLRKKSEGVISRGCGSEQRHPSIYVESTMQELMEELSYLGNMIEDNAVKSF